MKHKIKVFFRLVWTLAVIGGALMKQLKANRRTAEYRMLNIEVWNRFRLRLRLRPDRSLSLF